MFGAKEVLADLSKRLADHYEQLIQTKAKFDELRTFTKETIDEFKRLLERQEEKIERIEKDRIRAETELLTKINNLEGRLNALSEHALHAVARDAAQALVSDRISGIDGPVSSDYAETKDSDLKLVPPGTSVDKSHD